MVSAHLSRTMAAYVEGLKWAADVVHQEARWQTEQEMSRIPGAALIRSRMVVVETVLRNRVQSIEEEAKGE